MKAIITLLAITCYSFIHGQIMHQTVREDKTHEYWFSLDQYQKPMNYAIEIAHLGGNINKLNGKINGNKKSGLVVISDTKGKKLFEEGTPTQEWQLTESVISTKGVIMASYIPGGKVKSGSYVPDKVSDAEIERRKKWMEEEKASKV